MLLSSDDNKPALSNCTTVCRAFEYSARKALYKDIVISQERFTRPSRVEQAVVFMANHPRLANMVQSVTLRTRPASECDRREYLSEYEGGEGENSVYVQNVFIKENDLNISVRKKDNEFLLKKGTVETS